MNLSWDDIKILAAGQVLQSKERLCHMRKRNGKAMSSMKTLDILQLLSV